MSNISTFGTFTVARLGIYASQKAIDIVANNIGNINTTGYTRQEIDQISLNMGATDRFNSMYNTRIGSGAFVIGVNQSRDQYLDILYRDEQASVGAMEGKLDALNRIDLVLDEVGRGDDEAGVIEAQLNTMIQQLEALTTKGPGRDEFDSLFRSSATSLVNTLHSYSSELQTLSENMRDNLHKEVDNVNTILERIRDLNASIRKTQLYGGNSLEQQDERNLLIDQLSAYTRIDVSVEKEYMGDNIYLDKTVIRTADVPERTLVDGIFATKISIRQDKNGNDDPNYNLKIGPLYNANGAKLKLDNEDYGGMKVDVEDVSYTAEPASKDAKRTLFETEEEAQAVVDYLNQDMEDGEYAVKEIFDQDRRVSAYIVATGNTDRDTEGEHIEGVDYVAYHITTDYPMELSTPEDAELEEGEERVEATTFSGADGKKQAEKIASIMSETLPENVDFSGRILVNEYRVVQTGFGETSTYEIHRFQTYYGETNLNEQDFYGKLQAEREALTRQGIFSTEEQIENDPDATIKRGIPYYQKVLDVMANSLATTLNDANVAEGPLFSNSSEGNNTDGITASNISISKNWANGSLKVDTSSDKGERSTANENLTRILSLLSNTDIQFTAQGAAGFQEMKDVSPSSYGLVDHLFMSESEFNNGMSEEEAAELTGLGYDLTDYSSYKASYQSYNKLTDEEMAMFESSAAARDGVTDPAMSQLSRNELTKLDAYVQALEELPEDISLDDLTLLSQGEFDKLDDEAKRALTGSDTTDYGSYTAAYQTANGLSDAQMKVYESFAESRAAVPEDARMLSESAFNSLDSSARTALEARGYDVSSYADYQASYGANVEKALAYADTLEEVEPYSLDYEDSFLSEDEYDALTDADKKALSDKGYDIRDYDSYKESYQQLNDVTDEKMERISTYAYDRDHPYVLNTDARSQEVFFTGTFQELLTNHMEGNLASDIQIANTMLGNYQSVSEELYVDRDGVMGVDLNDEVISMMMYQKSYSAACRLMTVFDEMIDKLINGMAV